MVKCEVCKDARKINRKAFCYNCKIKIKDELDVLKIQTLRLRLYEKYQSTI
jgi:hypothetical protein